MRTSCCLAFIIYLCLALTSARASDGESECRASDSLYDGRIAPIYSEDISGCFTDEILSPSNTYPLILDLRTAESLSRIKIQSVQKVQEAKLAALVSSKVPLVIFADSPYSQRHLEFCNKYGVKLIQSGTRSLIKNGFVYQTMDGSAQSDPFNIRSTHYADLKSESIIVLSNEPSIAWHKIENVSEEAVFSKDFLSTSVYLFDAKEYPALKKDIPYLKTHPNLYYVDDLSAYLKDIVKSHKPGISPISNRRCG